MKRLLTFTSAAALILTASATFAVDETTWGQIKQDADHGSLTESLDQETVQFNFGSLMPAGKRRATDDQMHKNSQSWLDKNRSKTKRIGKRGGKIVVGHKTMNHGEFTLRAEFSVPAGALDKKVPITMTLVGDRLENLTIEFAPAGLTFDPSAVLTLKIGKKRAPKYLEGLEIKHIYEDGTVVSARWHKEEHRKGYRLDIGVPGFSRYSMGGF